MSNQKTESKVSINSFHLRSFVIPISDGKDDRHDTSTISAQSNYNTSLVGKPVKGRRY